MPLSVSYHHREQMQPQIFTAANLTDVIGLTSSFTYGPNDFVSALRTPYETTTFRHEANDLDTQNFTRRQ